MRKAIFLLILSAFLLLVVSRDAIAQINPENFIQLKIISDKKVYEFGRPISITLEIKNISNAKISILTIPTFELRSILRPNMVISTDSVKLDKEPVHSNVFGTRHLLEIAPFETKTLQYNLSVMKWGSIFSLKGRTQLLKKFLVQGEQYSVKFILKFSGKRKRVVSSSITFKIAERKCDSDKDCKALSCLQYDKPGLKEGYKPHCVDNRCKCMCYGRE